LYLEAEAVELNNPADVQAAQQITQSRKGGLINEEEYTRFVGDSMRRVYRAVPKQAWVNDVENDDADNYIRHIRVEIDLSAIRGML
jgi:hypothetical protein